MSEAMKTPSVSGAVNILFTVKEKFIFTRPVRSDVDLLH